MDAYAKSKTPPADRDRRATPPWVYAAICEAIGIDPEWDACAEPHTAVTGRFVKRHWTAEDDALKIDWASELTHQLGYNLHTVWVNPPYSDPAKWCAKAACEAKKGLIVVGLLPDDRSAGWYQEHIHGVAPTVFLTPSRVPFIMPETGKEQSGNPKGSIIPIWTPWRTGSTAEAYIPAEVWARHKPNRKRII